MILNHKGHTLKLTNDYFSWKNIKSIYCGSFVVILSLRIVSRTRWNLKNYNIETFQIIIALNY